MHVKPVNQLSDWFDCLIVLSASKSGPEAHAFAEDFLARGWVWMDGRALAPRDGRVFPYDDPAEAAAFPDGPDGLTALHAWLRSRGLGRPLFWAEGPGFEQLLGAFPHAFSVRFADGETSSDDPTPDLWLTPAGAHGEADLAAWVKQTAQTIVHAIQEMLADDKSLNVLVLYDDQFTNVSTIYEHLLAYKKYSRHNIFYLPGSNRAGHYEAQTEWPEAWDLSYFDVVVWHYTIRAANEWQIYDRLAEQLARFTGLKVLFIQDEYDELYMTWRWVRQVGINLVMSTAPNLTSARLLYPKPEFPDLELLTTLTGYVPEDNLDRFITPGDQRSLRIGYRGRTLSYQYGRLGREKYSIGVDVRRLAEARGVDVNIGVDEESRIYGDDWYRFMGSARATLASESGSLVVDFDGTVRIAALKAMAEGQPYEQFYQEHLADIENTVPVNAVSPRVFEAIRLRTALVAFEGEYCGVIQPGRHYIPLKKDFSNIDEVFEKLEDLDFLKTLTDRAYDEIIGSGAYSYRTFIHQFDDILCGRALRPWSTEIMCAPILRRQRDSALVEPIRYQDSVEYALNATVLRVGYQAPQIALAMHSLYEDIDVFYKRRALQTFRMHRPPAPPEDAVRRWRIGPDSLTITNTALLDGARLTLNPEGALVETVAEPGRYAAAARIDLSAVDLTEDFCWLRVVFRDVQGELRVCLFDTVDQEPGPDIVLMAGPGEQEVFFQVDGSGPGSGLVIRSSEFAGTKHPAGSGVFVEAEMLIGSQYDPRLQAIVRRIVANPNNVFWASGSIAAEAPPLHLPPPQARVLQAIPATDLFSVEYWRNRGASAEAAERGMRLVTPATAFTYAAAVRLDLGQVDFETQACWIKVMLTDVKGAVQVGLSSADGRMFACETNLPQMTVDGAVHFRIDEPVGDLLMFRTGPLDVAGGAVFLGAQLLVAPAAVGGPKA